MFLVGAGFGSSFIGVSPPRTKISSHVTRTSTYQAVFDELENQLDLRNIDWPMSVHEIKRFEHQNSKYSFHVFNLVWCSEKKTWDVVGPVHFAKTKKENHFNFLMYASRGITHYVWIKNLGKLVASQHSSNEHKLFACERCLNLFVRKRNSMLTCSIAVPCHRRV